ncbi:MAG: transposase [Pirellulales bacterium]|nr:transposase [Pirellulales bacterium]
MPRTARASRANWCYHVLNRGNAQQQVYHKDGDYLAFLNLIDSACERVPMRVLGWCLMPNHFHLLLWPRGDGDLGRWMQWLLTSHVRRYHRHHGGSGHVWQGRFKAFPIQQDDHLRTVLRYVERNPLRAGLVARSRDWPWSSLRSRLPRAARPRWLCELPVSLPAEWPRWIDEPQSDAEQLALRRSIARGTPFGSETWTRMAATRLGLEATLRPRGRPRKAKT